MKLFLLSLPLLMLNLFAIGQEVNVGTDKNEYKLDELIRVTYDFNSHYDSVKYPVFEGLEKVGKPTGGSSTSSINGEKKVRHVLTFSLKPMKSGIVKIETPVYYVNGEIIHGEATEIKISSDKLSPIERKEKEVLEFGESIFKPDGTMRAVIHQDKGYLEIYTGGKWEFKRMLTNKEIRMIGRLN